MATEVKLRPEDRFTLKEASRIKSQYPEMKLRMDWLKDAIGATHDELIGCRRRIIMAGLWTFDDDYCPRRPQSPTMLHPRPRMIPN